MDDPEPETYEVRIMAGDGWVTIPHTREEYERLWKDVDLEAAHAMEGFNR